MITVPADFIASIATREGATGRRWLADLPRIVDALSQQWKLVLDGAPWSGHLALVLPVRQADRPCALKISWQDADTAHEAHALELWQGRDVVELLASSPDDGAMLLERLAPERTLFTLPLDAAFSVAGRILRNLAIPGDDTFPTVPSLARKLVRSLPHRWREHGQGVIPSPIIDRACELAARQVDSTVTTMVNWDLHHGNVLFSPHRQQWFAIDPKPALGVPESGLAPLFWTRITDIAGPSELHRLLDKLIDVAELDAAATRDWLFVRAVDFWLWELAGGLTDDPGGCALIIDWLDHP